jgi:hypothetical protein
MSSPLNHLPYFNQSPGFECSCYSGYHLVNGICVDLDECTEESNPCGLGECINESGGYQCLCPKGYQFEQSVCKDINECEQDKTSSPCGSHGDCINLEGGFNCSCHPGFTTTINTDNNNETMECIDYNECEQDTNSCGSHGECINLEGELTDYLIFLLNT